MPRTYFRCAAMRYCPRRPEVSDGFSPRRGYRVHTHTARQCVWGDLFKLFRVRLDPENPAGRFSSGRVAVCCAYFQQHNTTTTTTTTIRYDDHAILRILPNSFAAPTTVCRKRPATVVVADRGGRAVFLSRQPHDSSGPSRVSYVKT